ncbi:MAG TPA: PIN domain-containing protein [bacterium]|nr:PIN domain-containing protein [bacterium]
MAFQKKAGLSPKDAVHLACAHYAGCNFFLTCDQELIKRSRRLRLELRVMNPVDYVRGPE